MSDKLERPMQIIQFGGKEIVVPANRPYITPAQARALYGPTDSLDPRSVLGALFDLKSEVMQVVADKHRKQPGLEPSTEVARTGVEVAKTRVPTQLDWDFHHVALFSDSLMGHIKFGARR